MYIISLNNIYLLLQYMHVHKWKTWKNNNFGSENKLCISLY